MTNTADTRVPLRLSEIIKFWLPLTTTWLLMALESPYVNSAIARMSAPKENLAAFGLAFAMALIIETPVLMLLTTTTTLISGPRSFARLRAMMLAANSITVVGMLLLSTPLVFGFLTLSFFSVPSSVAELAHAAIICLIPWPSAVGYRRFYQGIMIKHGRTKFVAIGTIIRLLGMGSVCAALFLFSSIPGAVAGAIAISSGVLGEAAFARWASRDSVRETLANPVEDCPLEWRRILKVYIPLTITILITFLVHSVNTYFTSHGLRSIESLAVIPVVGGIAFLIFSLAFSMQETVIVLGKGHEENIKSLRRFVVTLSSIQLFTMLALGYTSIGGFVLNSISGLSGELLTLGQESLSVYVLQPVLATWIVWNKALLLRSEQAKLISWGSLLELITMCSILPLTIYHFNIAGAYAVPLCMTITAGSQILYFQLVRRALKA